MDYGKVLKRAWHALWRYRALWIWGMVLALTASSWSPLIVPDLYDTEEREWQGLDITVGDNETFVQALRRTVRPEIEQANRELNALLSEVFRVDVRVNILTLIALLIALALALTVVTRIVRYVSEVALIRQVDHYEGTGERHNLWQGLRLGWSRSAWRLFLINLLVDVLGILASIALFSLLFAPLSLWIQGGTAAVFVFSFLTAGLFFVALAAVLLGSAALSVLKRLAWRACTLEGRGALASIGQGAALLAHHLKDVGLVWLLTVAVRWSWYLALVPVVLALLGVGLVAGSLPALLVGGATSLVSSGNLPVFLGLAVGIPLFFIVLLAPLLLLAGWREVYLSAVWTLTYRDLRALGSRAPQPSPTADPRGLEAAPAVP
jgi:hypothetical protein